MTTKNPLLEAFNLPPFSKIKTEHFQPAFEQALANARKEIDQITQASAEPSFDNTIAALDYAGEQLDRISSLFFNLNSAETNPELQKTAQTISPLLSEFQNDIILNENLFEKIKVVYQNKDRLDLTPEQEMLLDKKYRSFVRNGALLNGTQKKELRSIDQELARLSLSFGEHVLADTNDYELFIEHASDLKGLPEQDQEQARLLAKARGKEGYLFTLHYPSYLPFMKYVANRDLRKKFALAQGAKGFQENKNNNEAIVLAIAQLRLKRAQLLGFQSHADYVLQERMAQSPECVKEFLNDLLSKAKPAAQSQFQELSDFAKEIDDLDHLEKWDAAYYSEKLKQKKFELHEEELKPYFQLEKVLEGAFKVAYKLYGLTFEEVNDVDKYHEEVRTFRVLDVSENLMAIFYTDFHPRAGKRGGAWMTTYCDQMKKEGENIRPLVSIVCNFSRPSEKGPALLSFSEVTTLFHEFGHSLHAIMANTTYPSLSGTSVYWDFVELPSQLMENWCYEPETLKLFAYHYQTGKLIPQSLIDKIKESANFLEGIATLRQLSFGLLDMAWHGTQAKEVKKVKPFEVAAFASTQLYPDVASNCMSTSFSHIFQGGYSAGYYSYKWAEVLDADTFAYFKEHGIFDPTIAQKFRDEVLSKGGTENPEILYERFRGRAPRPDALLERAGLLTTKS